MKLRDCDSCLVYGTDNRPLARARVAVTPNGGVQLFFGNFKLYSARFKTFVDFYDTQQGLIRCYCELVVQRNTYPNKVVEPWMADCELIEVYDVFQRQQDLRVKTHIGADCRMEDGQFFVATIRNTSAGGLYMVTSQVLKVGDVFSFRYRFDGELCQLKAKTLRVSPGGGGGFGYGCKFVGLSKDAEAAVRKFVFAKQREKSRRM